MTTSPLLQDDTPTGDAIVSVLEAAGVDHVFVVSGGHTGKLIPAFESHTSSIRSVFVRQETIAAPMAETYGRLTGRPGVVVGQGPWLTGWGWTGVMEAMLSSSPMVMLTDFSDQDPYSLHAPYQSGSGHYGSVKLEQALGAVVKQVFTARTPSEAVAATQLAVKHALAGDRGPTAVLMTGVALAGSVGPESLPRLYQTEHFLMSGRLPANPKLVAHVASLLRDGSRTAIIAGNGVRVSGAQRELLEFAERIGAPVATTLAGKGCFPETHRLALGPIGSWGTPTANAFVGEAELVIVVGSRLGVSDTVTAHPELINPTRQTLVQIDIEPRNAAWTFPVDHALVGDAAAVLRQLGDALGERKLSATGRHRITELRQELGYFDAAEYQSDAQPIQPQRLVAEMMRSLPDECFITCDAGENRLFMSRFYQTKNAHGYLQSGTGAMGYAIPSAMTAQLLHPDRPVVAVCGDGGFAMSMNGLMSAKLEGLAITVVVMNNLHFGMSMHGRGSAFGTELGDFDHAAIAESMGCSGIRVTDPADLREALCTGVSDSRPTVIDVRTSSEASYLDFAANLKARGAAAYVA